MLPLLFFSFTGVKSSLGQSYNKVSCAFCNATASHSKKLTTVKEHDMYHNCYYYNYSQIDYNIVIKAFKE